MTPKHPRAWTPEDWKLWRANADWLKAYGLRREKERAVETVKERKTEVKR